MPTHRLAAIMFTDIVGYTALMQGDRGQAMASVKQHESILKDRLAVHGGELVHTYGDGSLSLLDSASAAVQCAKEIQETLRGELPLRIGIHVGEVTRDGDHIFGDAVNIASRIESMGKAGAILFSKELYQRIKNRPEFEATSLGDFVFKNVEEPMEVFALANEGFAVPLPTEMKGKGMQIASPEKQRNRIIASILGIVGLIALSLVGWKLMSQNKRLLPAEIREEKVAVAVFNNYTNQDELETLGFLGSEWISNGLRELGIRTVSPEMVRRHKEKIGILPSNAEGEVSFSEVTGAQYLISGSYYLTDDTLVLHTRLSSAINGEEVRAFPQLKRHISEKEKLVDEAREYLLGYWVLKQDQQLPNINPPKYEAYEQYLDCFINSKACLEKVLALDSSFLLVRVALAYVGVIFDDPQMYEYHHSYVRKRWKECTQYEKNYLLAAEAMMDADYEAAFQAFYQNYLLDERNYIMLNEAGTWSSVGINRPDLAVDLYEGMLNRLDLFGDIVHDAGFYHYQNSLNRLGEYEKAATFYEELTADLQLLAAPQEYLLSSLQLNKVEEARRLLDNWPSTTSKNWESQNSHPVIVAAYIYAYLYPEVANPFEPQLRAELPQIEDPNKGAHYALMGLTFWNMFSKVTALYTLKEWEACEDLLLSLRDVDWEKEFPSEVFRNMHECWVEASLGAVYARKGEQAKMEAQLALLDKMQEEYFQYRIAPWFLGAVPYLKARVYGASGDKEKAVKWLKQSIDEGKPFIWWNITLELDFVSLRGYGPFEELIRPGNGFETLK